MDSKEFKYFREKLNKTQKQMAELLGTSLKAVHSYEQGWRSVPLHVERQILFLICRTKEDEARKPCWVIKECPSDRRKECPVWEFQAGKLCWFVSGSICEGKAQKNWQEKMKICRSCKVFKSLCNLKAPLTGGTT
jgi:DNA-binding XRE family transcriptional regulator